jgi:Inorganic Pyrophosphatase
MTAGLNSSHDAAARRAHRNPTEAQKESGNYRKGHIVLHGLPITIENARGSTRRGIGPDGKPWSSVLPAHYGYLKGSTGADGDHVDCYIGKYPASKRVFVVNQHNERTGRFDEHKCMLAYPNKAMALKDYERAFSDGKGKDRIGSVVEMNLDDFKERLKRLGAFVKSIKRAAGGRIGYAEGGAPSMFDDLPSEPKPGMFDDLPSATGAAPSERSSGTADFLKSVPTGAARTTSALASDFSKGLAAERIAMGLGDPYEVEEAPTAAESMQGLESVTGSLHRPEGTAGQFGQTVGEFLGNPLSYVGPGGAISKILTAGTSALGSEALGQAVRGTSLETPARVAGAVIGGRGAAGRAASAERAVAPTVEELYDAADAGYTAARGYGVGIRPQPIARLADDIFTDLGTDGFRERNVPKTWNAIQELKDNTGLVGIEDLDSVRRVLRKAASNPLEGAEREASSRAISAIDKYVSELNPNDVAVNPHFAERVGQEIQSARGNYAAAKRAELLADKTKDADLQAAATGSGGNINNAMRQKIKSILTNPRLQRGFSQDELDQMDKIVRGTATGNIARLLGKLAPTGVVSGGLGLEIGSHLIGGPAGLSAVPIAGAIAKKIGDMSTRRQVGKLDEMVRNRSPLATERQQALPPPQSRTAPRIAPASTTPLLWYDAQGRLRMSQQ